MNERIKELFNIATEYTESQDTGNISQVKLNNICAESFAELIVRECVGVADDYVKDCTCDEHKNCKHPRSAIGRKIQEHFGVEE